jgi:hypothetical protein
MDAARQAPTLAGKVAAYSAWIGQTAKAVSAINAAGGTGGGGVSGGASIAQGATGGAGTQSVEWRVYGIDRDALMSGAMWERIWNGLAEEGKRRGVSSAPNLVFV